MRVMIAALYVMPPRHNTSVFISISFFISSRQDSTYLAEQQFIKSLGTICIEMRDIPENVLHKLGTTEK